MHVVDAQSPARVEFLDRYDDATPDGLLIAAYRPHEFLTAHVADTMAATVGRSAPGPVSKRQPGVRRSAPATRSTTARRTSCAG